MKIFKSIFPTLLLSFLSFSLLEALLDLPREVVSQTSESDPSNFKASNFLNPPDGLKALNFGTAFESMRASRVLYVFAPSSLTLLVPLEKLLDAFRRKRRKREREVVRRNEKERESPYSPGTRAFWTLVL